MKKSEELAHHLIQEDLKELAEKYGIPYLVMAYRLGDSLAVVGAGKESATEMIAAMVVAVNDAMHDNRDRFVQLEEQ